eukprot:TRINITY_DN16129_c0_g1_i2.p1 TRINITY_DN16129_c0_g1~~TRINITY_DN16129_c0_g1_i2.p1  ORF type:complete len:140 (+),score=23.13 TRINITY_DN16129_c0_g1_i2:62-481(+)
MHILRAFAAALVLCAGGAHAGSDCVAQVTWSDWSECAELRHSSVDVQKPASAGGAACPDPSTESRTCSPQCSVGPGTAVLTLVLGLCLGIIGTLGAQKVADRCGAPGTPQGRELGTVGKMPGSQSRVVRPACPPELADI